MNLRPFLHKHIFCISAFVLVLCVYTISMFVRMYLCVHTFRKVKVSCSGMRCMINLWRHSGSKSVGSSWNTGFGQLEASTKSPKPSTKLHTCMYACNAFHERINFPKKNRSSRFFQRVQGGGGGWPRGWLVAVAVVPATAKRRPTFH